VKIVFDTNVLLSAAFFPGTCETLLMRCFTSSSVEIIVSEHILSEFVRHGAGKLGGEISDIERSVAELRARGLLVQPAAVEAGVVGDADDLPVLGTALAGEADLLVTGDRELLTLGRIGATVIVSPRHCLDRLQAD